MRKVKIIATIGPTSRDEATLERLIEAGMDVARLNFSHGTFPEHAEVIERVRRLAKKHNRHVAVLQDLGGIKLRLGVLDEPVQLNHGDEITITAEERSSQPNVLPFPQPEVLQRLQAGDLVFISDGVVCLEVLETDGSRVKTRVRDPVNLLLHAEEQGLLVVIGQHRQVNGYSWQIDTLE